MSCSSETNNSNTEKTAIQKIDTLKYSYHGFNNGQWLALASNGNFINETYQYGCFGGGERKIVYGTYNMDSVLVQLFPKKVEFITYLEDEDLIPIKSQFKYGNDSLKIKTEYHVINWDSKTYLLSESYDYGWNSVNRNDFIRFADYINSGLEPAMSGKYLTNSSTKAVDPVFDFEQIPEAWQKYFLKEPISAKIIGLGKDYSPDDENHFWWKVEINKGSKHGIYKGISLSTKDNGLYFEIDSVFNDCSFGKFHHSNFVQ